MKLVQKFTLALILGITVVLAANGYFRIQREVALIQADRVRDHELLGLALGAAFATVWRTAGEARAEEVLEQARAGEATLGVRYAPTVPAEFPPSALTADATTTIVSEGGASVRRTFVPIRGGREPGGGLVISEPLAAERGYVERTWIDTVLTTGLLAVLSAVLCATIGGWFIGRPVRALMAKARRVGQGDFSEPLHLRQRDELAALAREMNLMCDRLVEAEQKSFAEAAARLAALEQLRHADRLMTVGKLASGIAHELGTPLNVVSARAGMIAEGETEGAESQEYARIIVVACDQMTKIIRQLLDFARPRGPERSSEDVRRVVERTLALLEPLAAKKRLPLVLHEDLEPVFAELDAGQIQQVVTNLVANAIQASERGSVEVFVGRVMETRQGEAEARPCVCIRVRDEGVGIAPDHLDHIFEPFFTTKDVGQGTGLGLSIAYGIVREHQGWITVTSELGRGTEFRVFLPASLGPEGSP